MIYPVVAPVEAEVVAATVGVISMNPPVVTGLLVGVCTVGVLMWNHVGVLGPFVTGTVGDTIGDDATVEPVAVAGTVTGVDGATTVVPVAVAGTVTGVDGATTVVPVAVAGTVTVHSVWVGEAVVGAGRGTVVIVTGVG